MLKRYLFLMIFVCLFTISAVSAEEIGNETISYESTLMGDSVSEYDLSMFLSDEDIQRSADNGTFTDLQKKINDADADSKSHQKMIINITPDFQAKEYPLIKQ